MTKLGKYFDVKYDNKDKIFHYSGILISEDNDFIELDDKQCGKIFLNKNRIILLEVKDDFTRPELYKIRKC